MQKLNWQATMKFLCFLLPLSSYFSSSSEMLWLKGILRSLKNLSMKKIYTNLEVDLDYLNNKLSQALLVFYGTKLIFQQCSRYFAIILMESARSHLLQRINVFVIDECRDYCHLNVLQSCGQLCFFGRFLFIFLSLYC